MLIQNQHSTRKVSAARGIPRGARTVVGQVNSLAVPSQVSLLGLSRTHLLGTQGPRASDKKVPLCTQEGSCRGAPLGPGPLLQWKILQVPEQQHCSLWHERPHSQV